MRKKSINPFKTEQEKFLKATKELREQIPERYNQIEFIDELVNQDVSKIFSITSRSDGKTTNFFGLFTSIANMFDLTGLVIMRHYELRTAMIEQIIEAVRVFGDLKPEKIAYRADSNYIYIMYEKKIIYIIVDLNNANDLKNYSSVLKQAQITIFDEFIDVFGYYADSEYAKFKTIFETMDKNQDIDDKMKILGGLKKSIFLGNPSSNPSAYASEIINGFGILPLLAKQKINTSQFYPNKHAFIERRKNASVQEFKNKQMFDDANNESESGEFYFNEYLINEQFENLKKLVIKTSDRYINLYFNQKKRIIKVTMFGGQYDFNTELQDIVEDSTLIDKKYIKDKMYKFFKKGLFEFADVYSKNYVLENYNNINYFKLIALKNDIIEKQDIILDDEKQNDIDKNMLLYANRLVNEELNYILS